MEAWTPLVNGKCPGISFICTGSQYTCFISIPESVLITLLFSILKRNTRTYCLHRHMVVVTNMQLESDSVNLFSAPDQGVNIQPEKDVTNFGDQYPALTT